MPVRLTHNASLSYPAADARTASCLPVGSDEIARDSRSPERPASFRKSSEYRVKMNRGGETCLCGEVDLLLHLHGPRQSSVPLA